MDWHLQDAKNNLSKVVQKALKEGPQTITLRGRRAALVVSAEEFDRMKKAGKRTLVDHILSGPEWPEEMIEEVNRRSGAPSRPPIDL